MQELMAQKQEITKPAVRKITIPPIKSDACNLSFSYLLAKAPIKKRNNKDSTPPLPLEA